MSYRVKFYQKIEIDFESKSRDSLLELEAVIPIPPLIGMIFRHGEFLHKVNRIEIEYDIVKLYCLEEFHISNKKRLIEIGWTKLI